MKTAGAAAAIAMTVVLGAAPAEAHVPDLTTARVTLRDAHIEIAVDADLVSLTARALGAAKGEHADATTVATADEATLASSLGVVRRELAEGAHLQAGGVEVPLVIRWFPSTQDVRAAAAQASAARAAGRDEHPRTSVVRIETTRSIGDAHDVRVSLPESVGRALYTFVQPESRVALAGAPAEFVVLAPPPRAALAPAPVAAEASNRSLFAFLAGIAAIVAIAVQLRPWRLGRRLERRQQPVRDGGGEA